MAVRLKVWLSSFNSRGNPRKYGWVSSVCKEWSSGIAHAKLGRSEPTVRVANAEAATANATHQPLELEEWHEAGWAAAVWDQHRGRGYLCVRAFKEFKSNERDLNELKHLHAKLAAFYAKCFHPKQPIEFSLAYASLRLYRKRPWITNLTLRSLFCLVSKAITTGFSTIPQRGRHQLKHGVCWLSRRAAAIAIAYFTKYGRSKWRGRIQYV